MTYDEYLDVTGLNCPLPILKTKARLNQMEAGKTLLVEATDPHAQIDFEVYCMRTNHELLNCEQEKSKYSFLIKCCHKT